MKSIKIKDGDIFISSKRLQMVTDLEQMMQKTVEILNVVLGELWYNGSIGLDRTEILDIKEKNIPRERKELAVIRALQEDSNIEQIVEVNLTTDSKSRTQSIDLKLKYVGIDNVTQLGGITVG